MKKLLILTLVLFVSYTLMSFRGCGTEYMTTIPDRSLVGVLYTNNNGGNWSMQPSFSKRPEHICCFGSNLSTFIVSMDYNTASFETQIFKTTNSGATFFSYYLNGYISDIVKTSDGRGIAVGSNTYITTNNGSNWAKVDSTHYGKAVDFADELRGIIIRSNPDSILYTSNGGISWIPRPPITTINYFNDIAFSGPANSTDAVVCGNGTIFRTTNSGNNWNSITSPSTEQLYCIDFRDQVGIIGGSEGTILRTSNGGTSWQKVESGTTKSLSEVCLTSSNYWALGNNIFLKSTDQGQTWSTIFNNEYEYYTDITCVNDSCKAIGLRFAGFYNDQGGGSNNGGDEPFENYSICAGDSGTIVRSSGETNIIFEQKTSGTTQRLNGVRVAPSTSDQTVIAVGNNGTITLSTNTGNDWVVAAPVTTANLYGAEFNSIYSYAVGDNGTVVWSFDGGATWTQVPSGTTRNLKAISLSNQFGSNVIAVGEKGTIIRSTNSGQNWINISLADTTVNFYDITTKGIYYNSGNNFCIVGSGGRIYKSTNGGLNWVQKTSGTTNTLRNIYQHTADSIVVVGDNGTIRFSTNGGETWFTDAFFNSPLTRHYKAISLINRDHNTFSALSDTLWFVSSDPFTVGVRPVSSEIPKGFSLSQNYPNPFNPISKIKMQISKLSAVKLVVFDILGREVETLVNEQLRPGTHEVEFDGSKYASGVYFYKLSAGDFTETRKMVLVK